MIEIRETDGFAKWLRKVNDPRARVRIAARLRQLALGHWGDVKPVGEGVNELRIHVGQGYRVYLAKRGDVTVLLLAGGIKASQQNDIARARALAKEWRLSWD